MDPNRLITVLLITTILIVVIITVGRMILVKMYPGWGHRLPSPGNATPTTSSFWQSMKSWKGPRIRWGWIILILLLLPFVWPLVSLVGLWWLAAADYSIRGTHPSQYGVIAPKKPISNPVRRKSRTENEERYKFFVETPRKHGWGVLPTEVSVDVPLDGQPRYLGINVAMLGGSRIRYDCPGYWSGGEVKLFAKADEPQFMHLSHEQTFNLYNTGSVTGGSAILIKGEKNPRYQGISNRVNVKADELPGHIRIATTRICETGYGYDWGTVQVGKRKDSPPWEIYIRFADLNGFTLPNDWVRQRPGQIMIGVMENGKFRSVFDEVVSKPANQYSSGLMPEQAEDLFLRIQPPNSPEGAVIAEVILDIDNTK